MDLFHGKKYQYDPKSQLSVLNGRFLANEQYI